jgi:hypothetical protein
VLDTEDSQEYEPFAELQDSLFEVLAGKLGIGEQLPWWCDNSLRSSTASDLGLKPGLMLIHGTVLWGEPIWSVPGKGRLFNYIQTLRPDVYGASDYFAWEGSYTFGGYGREIAAKNLVQWVQSRQLMDIDVVTHSHGGNVLLLATALGCRFRDVLLLSCPVRKGYKLDRRMVRSARSVRVRFDLILVADLARQRFQPRSGIIENVLPIWYVSHSTTIKPATWQSQNIGKYLLHARNV